jgi:hypothetical protein
MKAALKFAAFDRNGDNDDRRLRSRFGNADRSSVSLLFDTGLPTANVVAVSSPGMLRFSVEQFKAAGNRMASYSNFCF